MSPQFQHKGGNPPPHGGGHGGGPFPGGGHVHKPGAGGGHGGKAGPGWDGPGGGHGGGPGAGGGRRLAAPAYLANLPVSHFQQAPPGHTFRLYFRGWSATWAIAAEAKREVLQEIVPLGKTCKDMVAAAVKRQLTGAKGVDALVHTTNAAAPFTTGLGIEHPLENGFAFLDPYGLPYLPGSGVKGVVRRAAEELALFEADSNGWSIPAVWWLFGFDATSAFFAGDGSGDPKVIAEEREAWRNAYRQHLERLDGEGKTLLSAFCRAANPQGKDGAEQVLVALRGEGGRELLNHLHLRGALEFWDVIPEPADGKLRVDIMNPHYNHYYQEGKAPGDWGSPVPIYFLTLPVGSTFTFVVRFRPPVQWPEEVRASLEPRWRGLVEAALHFAWEWQGFGAKTAVGYGRMRTGEVKDMPPFQLPKGPGGA